MMLSYKSYKIISGSLFFLLSIAFVGNNYATEIGLFNQNELTQIIPPYSPTILSLLCLYFNVYAYKMKIEQTNAKGRPLTIFCVICASVAVFFSLAPPIIGYFSLIKINTKSKYELSILEVCKIRESNESANRKLARISYRKTQKRTKYLNENGVVDIYAPDESDRLCIRYQENYELYKDRLSATRLLVKVLLVAALVSFLAFLILLKYLDYKTDIHCK